MKRILAICLVFVCSLLITAVGEEVNVALLSNGGIVDANLQPQNANYSWENIFDGSTSTECRFEADKFGETGLIVDRIWDGKVEIRSIELRFRYTNRVPSEFKILYWDLSENEWRVLIHETDYTDNASNPIYTATLSVPIVTNKIRFNAFELWPEVTQVLVIREFYYYGVFVQEDEAPNAPQDVVIERLSHSSAQISWTAGDWDAVRIYKSTTESGEYTLAAEVDSTQTSWLDESCTWGRTYYRLASVAGEEESEPVDLILPGSSTISGTVLAGDNGGHGGLADVLVELLAEDESKIDETTTDANGQYSFTFVIEGSYKLLFFKEGYLPEERDFTIDFDAEPVFDFQIAEVTLAEEPFDQPPAPPSDASIERLSHNSARISWTAGDWEAVRIYKSDTEGGEYTLTEEIDSTQTSWTDESCTWKRTYYRLVSVADEYESEPVLLTLPGSSTVSGRVLTEDGSGFDGVLVELSIAGGAKIDEANTNANGEYNFAFVVEGNYKLSFSKAGYLPSSLEFSIDFEHSPVFNLQLDDMVLAVEPPPLVYVGALAHGGDVVVSGMTKGIPTDLPNLFDESTSSYCRFDARNFEATGLCIDRIWNGKVQIHSVDLRFRGKAPYEFKMLYWDLTANKWQEIFHEFEYVSEEQGDQSYSYTLDAPIKTNKLRLNVIELFDQQSSPILLIRELYYYGYLVTNVPPHSPKNVCLERLSLNSAQISWEDPGSDSEGEPVLSYRIYKAATVDGEYTLVAELDNTKFSWLDEDCTFERSYYQIVAHDGYDESEPVQLTLPGASRVTGRVMTEEDGAEKGLEGVSVEFVDENGVKAYSTTTDADGGYDLPVVVEGSYTVQFRKVGYYPEDSTLSIDFDLEPVQEIQLDAVTMYPDHEPPLGPVADENNPPEADKGIVTIYWQPHPESGDDLPAWYNVYRSPKPDFSENNLEARLVAEKIETTFWTDHEIPYSPVYYHVRAFDLAGNMSEEGLLFVVEVPLVDTPVPLAEGNGRVVEKNTAITLEWKAIEDAAAYDVLVSTFEDFREYELVEDIPANSFQWQDGWPEGRRFWRVRAKYSNGAVSQYSETGWFDIVNMDITDSDNVRLFDVRPAYIGANSLNEFKIQLVLTEEAAVSINIYDLSGRLVKTLANNMVLGKGIHTYTWDGRNNANRLLGNGLYLVHFKLIRPGDIITSVKRIGIFR